MNETLVLCAVESGVATLTLNNPPLNVVTLALTGALDAALDQVERSEDVRAIIVTGGSDRAFCAGSDITEFPSMMAPGQVVPQKLARQNAVFNRLDRFPKPTIAALRRLVYGGGLEIALCCDLLVAEEDVKIALPEIKLGLFPSSGGPLRVTRRIGESRAKELMFFGEPIDAATALSWGLVNRLVPEGRALQAARELAATLVERPRGALGLCKQAIGLAFDHPFDEALGRSFALSDIAFSAAEAKEGVAAFLEKRKADFKRL